MNRIPRIWVIFTIVVVQSFVWSSPVEDFGKCKEDGFSVDKDTLICDPRNDLLSTTVDKLNEILARVQHKLKCECPDICKRDNNLSGKFVGLLQVTNTTILQQSDKGFAEVAEDIYNKAGLGNDKCDNGMLLFYVKDTKELASMRGHGKFVVLKDQDLDRLHQLVGNNKTDEASESAAMQFLAGKERGASDDDDSVQGFIRAASDTWAPIVGLVVVGVFLFLIMALLLACCFARVCGCCRTKHNKKKYYVTPIPTYKTVEPIYIVTPPNDRHDLIYSTPYSGSPLPPPPIAHPLFLGSPQESPTEHVPYDAGSPRISAVQLRGATPSSGYRPKPNSVLSTPKMGKAERSGTSASRYSAHNSSSTTLPAVDGSSPNMRVDVDGFPFLDPFRKREVQTKEAFVE